MFAVPERLHETCETNLSKKLNEWEWELESVEY